MQGLQRDRCLQCNTPLWKVHSDPKKSWDQGQKRTAWGQGPPNSTFESQKASGTQDTGHRNKVTIHKEPAALLKALMETLEKDDEHKGTIAVLTMVMDKKNSAETAQIYHDKVKSLGEATQGGGGGRRETQGPDPSSTRSRSRRRRPSSQQ